MSSRSRKWQNCHRNPLKPCSKGLSPSTSGFSVVSGHLQHRHHSCPRDPERCTCHSSLALGYRLGRADHSPGNSQEDSVCSFQWFVFVRAHLKGKEGSWGTVGCLGGPSTPLSGSWVAHDPQIGMISRALRCPVTGPQQNRHFWARAHPEGAGLPAFAFLLFSKAGLTTREGSKVPGGSSIITTRTRTQSSPSSCGFRTAQGTVPRGLAGVVCPPGTNQCCGVSGGREGDCGLCQAMRLE